MRSLTDKKKANELGLSDVRIKENSWMAKMAAKKLGAPNVALVIGKTIYLYNVSSRSFLKNERWVKHEMCHIKQFREYGFVRFIVLYLWEYFKNGYHNNKFEVAARKSEEL